MSFKGHFKNLLQTTDDEAQESMVLSKRSLLLRPDCLPSLEIWLRQNKDIIDSARNFCTGFIERKLDLLAPTLSCALRTQRTTVISTRTLATTWPARWP